MTTSASFWSGFPHDPRLATNAALRAADSDRDRVLEVLAEAYADGRLDREEYDERSSHVSSARTLGELPPLVRDLISTESLPATRSSGLAGVSPDELRGRAVAEYEKERREAFVRIFLGPSAICTVIWLAVGLGGSFTFFWPGIVIAVTLLNAVRVTVRRSDMVEDRLRGLEKRQQRDQKKLRFRDDRP